MEIEARIDELGERKLAQGEEVRFSRLLIQHLLAQEVEASWLLCYDTTTAETADGVAHTLLPRQTLTST